MDNALPSSPTTRRVMLITGGSRGIGAATAVLAAKAGYAVAINYRDNAQAAAETANAVEAAGGEAWCVQADVANESDIMAMFAALDARFGRLDVLVNNAGITRDGQFRKMSKADWDAVISTNLNSMFNVTKQVIEGMIEANFGRVVNISSVNGQKGQFGQVNYAATKAGDLGIVKSLAQEGARFGITANAICPGYIATDMVMAVPEKVRESIIAQIPAGRLGEPEEIARCVAFLASDDAGFINGSTISANGAQFFV